jgi:hypothetical protein
VEEAGVGAAVKEVGPPGLPASGPGSDPVEVVVAGGGSLGAGPSGGGTPDRTRRPGGPTKAPMGPVHTVEVTTG